MVPVQVDRERVNIKQAEVAVEAQALENRQKFAEAGIELEIRRLRIAADKEVQIAMAEAIGMALSSSKMTLFGSPEMASTMLQSMAKGMGVRTMLEGFTGNGHASANGDAPANPLTGITELLGPIIERFAGKPVDAATLESVVKAALEAQSAKAAATAGIEAPRPKPEPARTPAEPALASEALPAATTGASERSVTWTGGGPVGPPPVHVIRSELTGLPGPIA